MPRNEEGDLAAMVALSRDLPQEALLHGHCHTLAPQLRAVADDVKLDVEADA